MAAVRAVMNLLTAQVIWRCLFACLRSLLRREWIYWLSTLQLHTDDYWQCILLLEFFPLLDLTCRPQDVVDFPQARRMYI